MSNVSQAWAMTGSSVNRPAQQERQQRKPTSRDMLRWCDFEDCAPHFARHVPKLTKVFAPERTEQAMRGRQSADDLPPLAFRSVPPRLIVPYLIVPLALGAAMVRDRGGQGGVGEQKPKLPPTWKWLRHGSF
jgi:hypothetical protein